MEPEEARLALFDWHVASWHLRVIFGNDRNWRRKRTPRPGKPLSPMHERKAGYEANEAGTSSAKGTTAMHAIRAGHASMGRGRLFAGQRLQDMPSIVLIRA